MHCMQARLYYLLLLAALFFWGWQTEMLWLGGLLAAVLIAAVWVKGRYHFDKASFFQVADLCALIAVAIFAFLWIDDKASKAVYPTLALLPVALLPLLILQLLDEKQQVPLSALMFLKRKLPTSWFDFLPLYIGVCLFSAATAAPGPLSYFIGLVILLMALLLLMHKQLGPKQRVAVMVMVTLAAGLGLMMQWLMVDWQKQIEANINQWLLNYHASSQTTTAIGDVGRLKLSDEIVLRVKPLSKRSKPMLLRKGSYLRYINGTWLGGSWKDQQASLDSAGWHLHEQDLAQPHELRIYQSFPRSRDTLALPARTAELKQLAADAVTIGQGGSVQATGLPPFAAYDVSYGGLHDFSVLDQSSAADLKVSVEEAKAVAQVAKELGLYQLRHDQGDRAVLAELNRYFFFDFSYSTYLRGTDGKQNTLSNFLLHSKSGHCEYFASATVLLLREVGIPARYAVGYSMHEWDDEADMFLVRGRDSHAWAIAEIDGEWRDVDNTPPNWIAFENKDRSPLQGLKDAWSDMMFAFKKWRYSESEIPDSVWFTLLAVLFVILAWRVLRQVNVEDQPAKKKAEIRFDASNWLLLEQELEKAGLSRLPGESLTTWLQRIDMQELLPFVPLYYQQRFDRVPDPEQQETLDAVIKDFRKRFSDKQAKDK